MHYAAVASHSACVALISFQCMQDSTEYASLNSVWVHTGSFGPILVRLAWHSSGSYDKGWCPTHQLCLRYPAHLHMRFLAVCRTQPNSAKVLMSQHCCPKAGSNLATTACPDSVLADPRVQNDLVCACAASNTGGSNGATMRCLISLPKADSAAPSLFLVLNLL